MDTEMDKVADKEVGTEPWRAAGEAGAWCTVVRRRRRHGLRGVVQGVCSGWAQGATSKQWTRRCAASWCARQGQRSQVEMRCWRRVGSLHVLREWLRPLFPSARMPKVQA